MACLNDCCGYFEDGILVVTGIFNEQKQNYIPYLNDLNIKEYKFLPANTQSYLMNFKEANCITFDIENLSSSNEKLNTYHCKLNNIKIKNKDTPGYPGDEFAKMNTTNNTNQTESKSKHLKPVVKKQLAFIEEFDSTLVQPNVINIDKRFLPSLKEVYEHLAICNSAICVLNVEPDWIHYNDYVNHGLIEFWNYAFEHQDRQCFLVFDNINITITRCGLLPLFDVLKGIRPKLPFAAEPGVPSNIHLIATAVKKDAPYQLYNPIDRELFSDWTVQDSNSNEMPLESFLDSCEE